MQNRTLRLAVPALVERRNAARADGDRSGELWPDARQPGGSDTVAGSLCLVTADSALLSGDGGGAADGLLADGLARRGWRVHVLYCGPVDDPGAFAGVARSLARVGCSLSHLGQFDMPPFTDFHPEGSPWYVRSSERVRHALEHLHRLHRFDLIEFGERHALGFRPVQAKRAGLAFGGVRLAVRLHGPSHWLRETGQVWMDGPDDLRLDFCERYAFEHADVALSPGEAVLDYVRSIGWQVPAQARLVPRVVPGPRAEGRQPAAGVWPEVVFVGLPAARGALEDFVEATRQLDSQVPVTFLGRIETTTDGTPAADYLRAKLEGRPYAVRADLDWDRALPYLLQGGRIAVLPAPADASLPAELECLANRIPFLAPRAACVLEVVTGRDLRDACLFEPTPRGLCRRLTEYLRLSPPHRQALCDRAYEALDYPACNARVAEAYGRVCWGEATANPGPETAPVVVHRTFTVPLPGDPDEPVYEGPADGVGIAAEAPPRVTVAVPYHNLPAYLPEALASLAGQTYPNLEVIVVDDGSTGAAALRVFEEQQRLYPQFRFISQANAGLGGARNRALAEARGEYFVPFDADNIARPRLIETLARGLRRNPGVSALTCSFLAFREKADIDRGQFLYAYRPTGGPHALGCVENVYGDATGAFRTADLRRVGGYETERDTTWEDWEAYVKLVNAGYEVDTVPEVLFYYRHRDDSLMRTTSVYRNHLRVLRQYFGTLWLRPAEQVALWTALVSLHHRHGEMSRRLSDLRKRNEELYGSLALQAGEPPNRHREVHEELRERVADLAARNERLTSRAKELQRSHDALAVRCASLRYRAADRLNGILKRAWPVQPAVKGLVIGGWRSQRFLRRLLGAR